MSFSSTTENDILKLYLNATAIANIADNAASSPLTNVYCALHTANPGTAPAQTTSEATYTSYARVAVPRTSSGWTVTGNVAAPTADVNFPTATGGSETETYASVGTASSGAGKIIMVGPISPSIVVTTGVPPVLVTSSALTLT